MGAVDLFLDDAEREKSGVPPACACRVADSLAKE